LMQPTAAWKSQSHSHQLDPNLALEAAHGYSGSHLLPRRTLIRRYQGFNEDEVLRQIEALQVAEPPKEEEETHGSPAPKKGESLEGEASGGSEESSKKEEVGQELAEEEDGEEEEEAEEEEDDGGMEGEHGGKEGESTEDTQPVGMHPMTPQEIGHIGGELADEDRRIHLRNTARVAHGIVMCIAFFLIFPLGGIVLRVLRISHLARWHGLLQSFGILLFMVGTGLGGWSATVARQALCDPHAIIGFFLIPPLLLQPAFGVIAYRYFLRTNGQRGRWSHVHTWLGRITVLVGIIDGGLGLQYSNASEGAEIGYAVAAVLVIAVWTGVIELWHSKEEKERLGEKSRIWFKHARGKHASHPRRLPLSRQNSERVDHMGGWKSSSAVEIIPKSGFAPELHRSDTLQTLETLDSRESRQQLRNQRRWTRMYSGGSVHEVQQHLHHPDDLKPAGDDREQGALVVRPKRMRASSIGSLDSIVAAYSTPTGGDPEKGIELRHIKSNMSITSTCTETTLIERPALKKTKSNSSVASNSAEKSSLKKMKSIPEI
ncbi:hypothetical protein LTS18_010586, partial [Coniosporium uncinatum]